MSTNSEPKVDRRRTWRKERRDAQIIGGVRAGEPCALCPHDWGQHGYSPPHKCCLCACVRFTLNSQEGEI